MLYVPIESEDSAGRAVAEHPWRFLGLQGL
jgi:hypothetical protein